LLRGINVSGKNIIKMDALKMMLSNLKYENITTYIQSGNVVFQSNIDNSEKIEKQIKNSIKVTFNVDIPVLIMEFSIIKKIIIQNPFVKDESKKKTFLHTTILSKMPNNSDIVNLESLKNIHDEFIIIGQVVYLYCPNGYGNTKLTNNFFEKKLNCSATTRNWNTMNKLFSLAELCQ
jgi:uncharacterized protein (DUF1697 family)